MKIWVVDTETTGLDPATDRVVEIAVAPVERDSDTWQIGVAWRSLVNPGRPISPEASGIHHIIDADVADALDLGHALDQVLTPMWPQEVDVVAAHNCRFDRDMLPPLRDKRWLDTYRCAMHVWPDAPNFQNATLFYWLGLERPTVVAPHSASFDVLLTANILVRLLAERSVDDLLKLSTKACVLRKVGFGKHFGQLWTEIPTSYLDWASGQKDMDPDVKFTVKTELARRAALQEQT